ncbi:hypothetical protein BGZ61DRAFT_522404 [Ilyonectria robusta]|uniref:uncharacterized protein n=1 Tax=Ilyonectria robusta TaxID=1079257 RepID=UPI001E8CE57A|nr:uncharacterized protein BGZ61DRAFT_522404 [Ilyonectria robusta]KAH8666151.1 hypothetical protein BGZ61DRAFT_522404 [Ilyonectria robusta]
MLLTLILHITRFSFLLLSNTYQAYSTIIPLPDHCAAIPVADEEMGERIFDRAISPHIRAIPADEFAVLAKGIQLTTSIMETLEAKGGPDALAVFSKASTDFAWEVVSLSATRDAFIHVFELVDEEALRAQYVEFFDAPLDTAEQEAAARAILCRIKGLPATVKARSNMYELQSQSQAIIKDVESRWKHQPEKLEEFLVKFLANPYEDDREKAMGDLMETVSSETDLVERLKKYQTEVDRKDEL